MTDNTYYLFLFHNYGLKIDIDNQYVTLNKRKWGISKRIQ